MSKSAETRARILDCALDLFRERGFAETTMRDIATAAGVATGASYYYFRSKEEIVMAFYERASAEMAPLMAAVLERERKLEPCLRELIRAKLAYFEPNRKFFAALLGQAANLDSPLSPFGEPTRPIREQDQAAFARALELTDVPKDLASHLPKLLWLYQMGVIFYWITDESTGHRRTMNVLDRSLRMVMRLMQLSSLPLMKPARKMVIELIAAVEARDEPA